MKTAAKKDHKLKNKAIQGTAKWYDPINIFFEKNEKILFLICMLCAGLMTILLFDMKVSQSGDDCDYILYAEDFWRNFRFPGFRGPLYPILLSPLVGIFGMNLLVLKIVSAIFILLSLWFLYKSFKGIVPAVVLIPAIFLSSICSFIFFYACHTYSEPCFMFMQSLFIYFFSVYFIRRDIPLNIKADWPKYLLIGAFALCMGLTRSIGYGVIGVAVLYFMINLRWKDLLYTVSASVLIFFAFQLIKSLIWPDAGSAYDIKNYLAKDYYNLNMGMEDLPGFYNRLIENSLAYLSAFLCQFMGVIPETPNNSIIISDARTITLYILFFVCFIAVFKKNKALLFTGIYVGIMNFLSFVLLQTNWGQDRLIMIYYPYILLFLLGGIYYLFQIKPLQNFIFIYYGICIWLALGTFSITKNRVNRNLPVLQQNLVGNELYGFTPDWENFIRGSQWAATNLPQDAVIVSRKPSISKVYTGRDFVWAPAALTVPLDTLSSLQVTGENTLLLVDISKSVYGSPYMKYIISYPTPIQYRGMDITTIGVYIIPNIEMESCLDKLNNFGLKYMTDNYQDILLRTKEFGHFRIFSPDMMLKHLEENNIKYLLLAQLRVHPSQKTGVFINNIHQYIWCISYKYPERFHIIHSIGNDEPCEIVEFIR